MRPSYALCHSDPHPLMGENAEAHTLCTAQSRYSNICVMERCDVGEPRVSGLHINTAFLPKRREEATLLRAWCVLPMVGGQPATSRASHVLPAPLPPALSDLPAFSPSFSLSPGSQQPRGRRRSSLFLSIVALKGAVVEGILAQTNVGWNQVAESFLRGQW